MITHPRICCCHFSLPSQLHLSQEKCSNYSLAESDCDAADAAEMDDRARAERRRREEVMRAASVHVRLMMPMLSSKRSSRSGGGDEIKFSFNCENLFPK